MIAGCIADAGPGVWGQRVLLNELTGNAAADSTGLTTYLLSEAEAREIVDHQIEVVEGEWREVCDLAGLGGAERNQLWRRQFLNPYATEGY